MVGTLTLPKRLKWQIGTLPQSAQLVVTGLPFTTSYFQGYIVGMPADNVPLSGAFTLLLSGYFSTDVNGTLTLAGPAMSTLVWFQRDFYTYSWQTNHSGLNRYGLWLTQNGFTWTQYGAVTVYDPQAVTSTGMAVIPTGNGDSRARVATSAVMPAGSFGPKVGLTAIPSAPVLVQHKVGSSNSSGTVTVTFTNPPTYGNTVLAVVVQQNTTGNLTFPVNWPNQAAASLTFGTGPRIDVWATPVYAGSQTVTVTSNDLSPMVVDLIEIAGYNGLDQWSWGSVNTYYYSSATNDMLLAIMATGDGATLTSWSDGSMQTVDNQTASTLAVTVAARSLATPVTVGTNLIANLNHTSTSPNVMALTFKPAFVQPPTAPTITSPGAYYATAGFAFKTYVTTTGYPPPSLAATGLPGGTSLVDQLNGTAIISGTTSVVGTSSVTVTATNGVGSPATQNFQLIVRAAQPSVESLGFVQK